LYYARDRTAGTVGVLLARQGGAVERLYGTAGSSLNQLYDYFSVSPNGRFVATHRPGRGVVLMRTDQNTFPGGKVYLELDPSPAPVTIVPTGVLVTNRAVYMITRGSVSNSPHTLWWAPTSGTAKIAAVKLPAVGGTSPRWIDDEIAASDDGRRVLVTAGGYTSATQSSSEDVIAVDAAGRAVNLSGKPGDYASRGSVWGISSGGTQLAVSTAASHAAYVKNPGGSRNELYVTRANGSGTPVQVSSSKNFSGSALHITSLRFLDDDTLVFSARGTSASHNDVFHFRVSTQTLTKLTRQNGSTAPFPMSNSTVFLAAGMGLSPNHKVLYIIAGHGASSVTLYDLWAVDLGTLALSKLTDGLYISTRDEGFGSCVTKPLWFFAARPKGVTASQYQLYSVDLNAASKPVRLTSISPATSGSSTAIADVTPSPDCSRVAFRHSDGSASTQDNVYTVKLGTTPRVYKITVPGIHYSHDQLQWSQDSQQLVFAAGTSRSTRALYSSPADRDPCCTPRRLYPSSGGYSPWVIFGVR
jgi:hypothetical protein